METNPYKYDTALPWIPQQNQVSKQGSNTPQISQQQLPRTHRSLLQHNMGQKPRVPEKMSKARALTLANTLKRTLAVASIIGFGMFGGLVAMHQVNTTTTQSTQSTSGSSNTSSKSSSSSQNSNNFFNQQGGNTSGTSSTSSTPVTGTSTS